MQRKDKDSWIGGTLLFLPTSVQIFHGFTLEFRPCRVKDVDAVEESFFLQRHSLHLSYVDICCFDIHLCKAENVLRPRKNQARF